MTVRQKGPCADERRYTAYDQYGQPTTGQSREHEPVVPERQAAVNGLVARGNEFQRGHLEKNSLPSLR